VAGHRTGRGSDRKLELNQREPQTS
jgi:hypothetical protein